MLYLIPSYDLHLLITFVTFTETGNSVMCGGRTTGLQHQIGMSRDWLGPCTDVLLLQQGSAQANTACSQTEDWVLQMMSRD